MTTVTFYFIATSDSLNSAHTQGEGILQERESRSQRYLGATLEAA